MKKQTIIGVIIGIIIFLICLSIYILLRNEWLLDQYNLDREKYEEYYEKFSERKIYKMSYDYNKIEENEEKLEPNGMYQISLKNAQINRNQIELDIETYFENGFGKKTSGTLKDSVAFSYYIYDNNKNLIANYIHTKDSKPILPYFYRENKKDINMSYEKYFWYVNDNNNLVNTSFDEKVIDEENSKINFVIDRRNDDGFQKFNSITLVLYDFTFENFSQYDPGDETRIEQYTFELPNVFTEIEINNINI